MARTIVLVILASVLAAQGLAAPCGDVDRSGAVSAADVAALRQAFSTTAAGLAAPGNCNLRGPSYPRDLDANGLPDECTLVDLVVLRRALASLSPGLQAVCGGDDFSPALGTGALTLPRGASVGVRVTVYRHPTFAADVAVSLANPPLGITADSLVFEPDSGDLFLQLEAHPELPDGPIQLQVRATSGALERTVPLALTIATSAASSQVLIENALAAGTIDYGTSLLYRGFALVGDARLPAAYAGAGSVDEDPTLFHEIEIANVSPALRAQLDTFLRRPGEAGSAYAGTPLPPPGPPAPSAPLPPPAPPAGPPCFGFAGFHVSRKHATLPVTAHAFCKSAYDGASVERALDRTLALVSTSWAGMTALMGDPLPDLSAAELADPAIVEQRGGGPEIDVYVVDAGDAEREGRTASFGKAVAYSRMSQPYTGHASSGYLVVQRSRLGSAGFRSDLVHELFHVLQFGHNREIFDLCETLSGETRPRCRAFWFTEASATWAERRFVPESAAREVHTRFPMQGCTPSGGLHLAQYSKFQCNDESLNASVGQGSALFPHLYAAYVWPSFMEQEAGENAIGIAWQSLETVAADDYGSAMAAVGGPLPFAANFRRFAVRDLNTLFPAEFGGACEVAGCANPIGTRWIDLPPGDFGAVDFKMPRMELEFDFPAPLAAGATPRSVADVIPGLKAHYYHFTAGGGGEPAPGTENAPGQWELDFSGLSPKTSLGIDAIVRKNDDTWEWRQNLQPDSDGKVSLCDVSQVYLVLSNAAVEDVPRENARRISGSYKIAPRETPCACNHVATIAEWNAQASFVWQTTGQNDDALATAYHAGNVTFRFVQTDVSTTSVTWEGTQLGGQITIDDHSEVQFIPGDPYILDDYYLRPPDPALTGLLLNVDLQTCRYTFNVITEAGGPIGGPRALPSGDYRTDPVSSLQLKGTNAHFPAWSRPLTLDNEFQIGGGTALVLVMQPPLQPGQTGNPFGVIPEGGTNATVNWTFEPIRPPPN